MERDIKEFELTVTVRNNRLKERRIQRGFVTQDAFSSKLRIPKHSYGGLETLRISPLRPLPFCRVPGCKKEATRQAFYVCKSHREEYGTDMDGWPIEAWPLKTAWIPSVIKIAKFFGVPPEELFPESVLTIKKAKSVVKADIGDVRNVIEAARDTMISTAMQISGKMPDDLLNEQERDRQIEKSVETLSPRMQRILRKRFGLGGTEPMTLDEVGESEGVSSERIRGIEMKALRLLRHPDRSGPIVPFAPPRVRSCSVSDCTLTAYVDCPGYGDSMGYYVKGGPLCWRHKDVEADNCLCSSHIRLREQLAREAQYKKDAQAQEERYRKNELKERDKLWKVVCGERVVDPPVDRTHVLCCEHGGKPNFFRSEKPLLSVQFSIPSHWVVLCDTCAQSYGSPLRYVIGWCVWINKVTTETDAKTR